ncbi:cytidine deaminase [Mycoplasma marinum]|uniref:Cytidine deaminase n=1 Tax=Mycoplasma marinum TaxID=1937190 RepID=A0A4R0XKD6_9MOLU|nr:cytidine deaminase [Mycoplasma marinum]TCG11116.1 cytidine deaminase [Mycoplasma marinum]
MALDKLIELQKKSYVPYSGFRVAAILIDSNNKEWKGVNVENAAYSPTNCAERSALFSAISNGVKVNSFKEIHIIGGVEDKIVSPCGVCRQVIVELMPLDAKVIQYSANGAIRINKVEELLPYGFTKGDLK